MNSTLSTHRLPAKTRLLSSNLLFLSLVVGFVIIVLSLVAYALNRIESQTRQSNGEALETVLYTTEAALELWQDQLITYVSEAAQNPQLVQSTIELLDSRGNQALDLANSALGTIRSLYQFQFERNLIQGIFVISPDAISIASMREENMGSRNIIAIQRPDLFGEVFEGRSLIVPPIRTDVCYIPHTRH
jgi:polar amino acid transport system substrate-binding protein